MRLSGRLNSGCSEIAKMKCPEVAGNNDSKSTSVKEECEKQCSNEPGTPICFSEKKWAKVTNSQGQLEGFSYRRNRAFRVRQSSESVEECAERCSSAWRGRDDDDECESDDRRAAKKEWHEKNGKPSLFRKLLAGDKECQRIAEMDCGKPAWEFAYLKERCSEQCTTKLEGSPICLREWEETRNDRFQRNKFLFTKNGTDEECIENCQSAARDRNEYDPCTKYDEKMYISREKKRKEEAWQEKICKEKEEKDAATKRQWEQTKCFFTDQCDDDYYDDL